MSSDNKQLPVEVHLKLTSDSMKVLSANALSEGKDVESFLVSVLESKARQQMLRELLTPLRLERAKSDFTDADIDAMIEDAREERYQKILNPFRKY